MHPVDDREFLGQRVRDAEMILRRAGDPADHLAAADPAEKLVNPLPGEAPPVRAHASDGRGVGDDGRRPFHRVDLRDQRRGDEPGPLVQLLVGPLRVGRLERVGDRVVLADEEGAHHVQSRATSRGRMPGSAPGRPGRRAGCPRRSSSLPSTPLRRGIWSPAAVPPPYSCDASHHGVSVLRNVCGPCFRAARVGSGSVLSTVSGRCGHGSSQPGAARNVLGVAGAVAEPVLDHELDPRRGQQVQARRGNEVVPGQQLTADLPRVRVQDPVRPS